MAECVFSARVVWKRYEIFMRSVLVCLVLILGTRGFAAPLKSVDMGGWDCSGSKVREVTVEPGEQVFTWHGQCGGAEGWDVVMEPKPKGVTTRMFYDAKTQVLELRVTNKGAARKVKLHVFVGFA